MLWPPIVAGLQLPLPLTIGQASLAEYGKSWSEDNSIDDMYSVTLFN